MRLAWFQGELGRETKIHGELSQPCVQRYAYSIESAKAYQYDDLDTS